MADEQRIPKQVSNMEPVDGTREIAAAQNGERDSERDEAREDQIDRDLAAQRASAQGAGISNRPLAEEKREQESLPKRLTRQGERDATDEQPEPERGAGARGRLAGPKPPDTDAIIEQPVMGVVPPEPNMPDEAGDVDYTLGDATRVREDPAGSGTPPGEEIADEQRRRELYRKGASSVSKG
jgi:hypothetical protein